MERKGSGIGKIINAYEFQVNYKNGKKPLFHSDAASFFAILPNLNYGTKAGTKVGTNAKLDETIRQLIRQDCKVSTTKMSEMRGTSVSTIKRLLSQMQDVYHVGSANGGHWEIKEDN